MRIQNLFVFDDSSINCGIKKDTGRKYSGEKIKIYVTFVAINV